VLLTLAMAMEFSSFIETVAVLRVWLLYKLFVSITA
jgi:hypothetical protein